MSAPGHPAAVDRVRAGRGLRAVRIRKGWRQDDVAERAACSRALVAKAEAGCLGGMTLDRLAAIANALGADFDLLIRWRGERLDRLIDEGHAEFVEEVVRRLSAAGWTCEVEATFSIWGERGSIDILGWREALGLILIVEVKSAFGDLQSTAAALDRKARLARAIAKERGWDVRAVAVLLAVGETRSNRRVVEMHRATFERLFPIRGVAARQWLASPSAHPAHMLQFLPFVNGGDAMQRSRVRRGSGGRSAVVRTVDSLPNVSPRGERRETDTSPRGDPA
jgi:transcriptional regulator with XRE-family HTH domain